MGASSSIKVFTCLNNPSQIGIIRISARLPLTLNATLFRVRWGETAVYLAMPYLEYDLNRAHLCLGTTWPRTVTYLCCLFVRRAGSLCGVFDKVVVNDVTLFVVLVAHRAAHHVHCGQTRGRGVWGWLQAFSSVTRRQLSQAKFNSK